MLPSPYGLSVDGLPFGKWNLQRGGLVSISFITTWVTKKPNYFSLSSNTHFGKTFSFPVINMEVGREGTGVVGCDTREMVGAGAAALGVILGVTPT